MKSPQGGQDSGPWVNIGLIAVGAFVVYGLYRWASLGIMAFWHSHAWAAGIIAAEIVAALFVLAAAFVWNLRAKKTAEQSIAAKDETAVYLGRSDQGEQIHLKQSYRTTHTQVIGTTSAGKTESVILPWAIRDLENDSGLLIIDGKSDKTFLEKFYAYAVRSNRKSDFRLFSLALPEPSATFNPLVGGTPYEITERVFSAFEFESGYYRDLQYKLFHSVVRLIIACEGVPTFILIQRLLTDAGLLKAWLDRCEDDGIRHVLGGFLKESEHHRMEKVSGLDAQLSHFTTGELGPLFNAAEPLIQMDEVLREKLICYFQLPSMYMPRLAAATGRLVLQSFQSAVSKRHLGLASKPGFFSCYLDDFQDYIYEGFGALLNKSRSANVGVVFSHQSLGDLDKVSPAFRSVVLTNTNVKCVMRNNDPDTCEYFSKSFGTETTEKVTERQTAGLMGESRTGDGSVREVEQFRFHPNQIRGLGTGEGIVTFPHFKGVKVAKLRFARREDIDPVRLPVVAKPPIPDIKAAYLKRGADSHQSRLTRDDVTQSVEDQNVTTQ